MTSWKLYNRDCRVAMSEMGSDIIDSIVTDPPYELTSARPGGRSPATRGKVMKGFMGMEWDGSGVAYDVGMWREALRVLKPGGWLAAFGGSRTYHRMASAIEDAGFDIRDQIMWLYGSGFPKGGVRDGIGTCLKPAHEPIVLARKPFRGSAQANIATNGTGGLNIDDCRVGESGARNNGRQAGTRGIYGHIGATVAVDYGCGRWPANVVHDGSDEVISAFPDAPGQLADARLTGERKTGRVYGEMGYPRSGEPSACSDNDGAVGFAMKPGARRMDSGSAARFFYCAKASQSDRDDGLDEGRNLHPTVKPEAVMRWLVRLITPAGGLVFDPFTGSGSTGKAAILESRSFIGCELTDEYVPLATARIEAAVRRMTEDAQRQGSLFGAAA